MANEMSKALAESILRGMKAYQEVKSSEQDLKKKLTIKKVSERMEQERMTRSMESMKEAGYDMEPSGVSSSGRVLFKRKKDDKPAISKGTSKWKMKDARSTLMREFLGQQYSEFKKVESKFDRYGPTWSKAELIEQTLKGKGRYKKAGELLGALGLSIDDFSKWSKDFNPELSNIAFPSQQLLRERQ